jgi:hypothetical protein
METLPKYSIIVKCLNPSTEVGCTDMIASCDAQNTYLNFLDDTGRLWKGIISEFIVIRNYPTKEDLDDFYRLKNEAIEFEKKQKIKEKTKSDDFIIY